MPCNGRSGGRRFCSIPLTGGLLMDRITGMSRRAKTCGVSSDQFERTLTGPEKRLLGRLDTPGRIQDVLDGLAYGTETIYRAPVRVLHERTCQCFDGAVFAAAMLCRIGYPPMILNLLPNRRDDDHVLALFKEHGHWGALAKSNFAGLRFRDPVYRTLRELVMSYFEHYYNIHGEKTLRGYTLPLNLQAFDRFEWMTKDETMDLIASRLDGIRRATILKQFMLSRLSPVDERSRRAGLYGANIAGLSVPPRKKN